jgi:hypothetical protein
MDLIFCQDAKPASLQTTVELAVVPGCFRVAERVTMRADPGGARYRANETGSASIRVTGFARARLGVFRHGCLTVVEPVSAREAVDGQFTPDIVVSMSSDLIAWIVAIGLGIAVVALGLRRNLGETTRNWLPRSEGVSEQETGALGPSGDGQRRRPLSPRQRQWMSGGFLLLGLAYAVMAMLWANDRLIHAVFAVLWVIVAVAYFRGKLPLSVSRSTS